MSPLRRHHGGPLPAAGYHDGYITVSFAASAARTSAWRLTTSSGDGVIRVSIAGKGGALLNLADHIGSLQRLRRRDTMTDGKPVERRLAAILAADVVGYSRLMGIDEVGTLRQLTAHRRECIDPAIAAGRGRIVKTTGDGVLAEFPSAVEAVSCAITIQRGLASRAYVAGRLSVRREAGEHLFHRLLYKDMNSALGRGLAAE